MNVGVTTHIKNEFKYLTVPAFEAAGVRHMYTTRYGGVSTGIYESLNFRMRDGEVEDHIQENIKRSLVLLDRDRKDFVSTRQVHKNIIQKIDLVEKYEQKESLSERDGLVTNRYETVLGGYYADCIILLYYDKRYKVIGLTHAGWRGTVLDIGGGMIKMMAEHYGSKPEDIIVALGPSICQNCFETDEDVPAALASQFGASVSGHIRNQNEKWHVDLAGINAMRLMARGVPSGNITLSGLCTCCGGEDFWSHRKLNEKRGVHAAFITI